MSGENFFSGIFQPVVLNTQGQISVAAGYKAKFYEAGTDIPKTIYTDPDLQVPYSTPSNIAYLDDTGKALIYLGVGGYKLVLTDANDTPVAGYTIDNIAGNGAFGTGFVNSFADLKDVNTSIFPYTYIGGYYIPGDGGEGMFYNQTSAQATDGGYIQESDFDPTKRWFRIPDENGDVRAASFGFCGSGDKTSNLLAADSYAATIGARLRIQVDPCTATSVTLTAPTVVFNDTAALYAGVGSYALVINGIVEAGDWKIFSGWDTVSLANSSQVSNPYWFGSSPSASADENTAAFAAWLAAGAGVFILPAGNWKYTGSFVPSSTKPTKFDGTILSGSGPSVQIYPGLYYPNAQSKVHTGIVEFNNNAILAGDGANGVLTADNFTASAKLISTGNTEVGANAVVTGNVTAGGYVQATGNVVGNNINATTAIFAGTDIQAGRAVIAHAGTSVGTNYKAAGATEVVIGAGNGTIAANVLTATNSYVKIIFAGTTTNATATVAVTVGGQTVYSKTFAANTTGTFNYHGEVLVFRTGATSAASFGWAISNGATGNLAALSDARTPTIDWSSSNTIAQSASTTNVKTLTMYEVYPA